MNIVPSWRSRDAEGLWLARQRRDQLRKPFGMLGTNDGNAIRDVIRADADGATANEAEHFGAGTLAERTERAAGRI